MKYRLLNFLICPKCKSFPLRLFILREEIIEREAKLPPCDLYCGYLNKYSNEIGKPPCSECIKHEIIDGYLKCTKCNEIYPIIDRIVVMEVDLIRPKRILMEFIEKYIEKLPKEFIDRYYKRE